MEEISAVHWGEKFVSGDSKYIRTSEGGLISLVGEVWMFSGMPQFNYI
jgi:hypothetical protein